MKKAYVEVRSQKSRGSSREVFGGPDTYVTVQVVPEGQMRLLCLNHRVAESRGIELIYVGEGYSSRVKTTRSKLGAALVEAASIRDAINQHEQGAKR